MKFFTSILSFYRSGIETAIKKISLSGTQSNLIPVVTILPQNINAETVIKNQRYNTSSFVKSLLPKSALYITVFILTNLFFLGVAIGQTNQATITITTSATSGGSFTGTAPNITFTPAASSANIQASALVTQLQTNNVTISTGFSGGTGTGNVTFSTAIAAPGTNSTQRTFTVSAGGSITVSNAIDLTPTPQGSNNTDGFLGTKIIMTAGTNITISANITTIGGAGGTKNAGSNHGGNGGEGGDVSLTAGAGSSIKVSGIINASGGVPGATLSGGNSGAIGLAGPGGITLTGNLTAVGGVGPGGNGTSSDITINDGAGTITTGGSTNDGQTSGVISGAGLTKTGTGAFLLAGSNTYTGTTTISQGTLSASSIVVSGSASNLGNATSAVILGGASTSGTLSYTGSAATYTRGFTINGGGGSIINTTATLLTIGTGGVANGGAFTLLNTSTGGTTISSSISSTGSIIIANSGSGVTTFSGSNNYSGGTSITSGTLSINSTTALGAITGAFSISNGAIANVSSNVTVGTLTLGSLGTANSTWGSTSSSATFKNNTYFTSTGVVTVSTDSRATPTVTPTIGAYTYNSSSQGPNAATNTGTGTSYTFSYVGVSGTTYSASSTPPTNAGSYTVTATVLASSDGFYKSASSSATAFSIGKATPTVTPTVGTYTYTGSAQGPNTATNSGTGTSYTFSYVGVSGTTYSASSTPPTNVGSYTVTATVLASSDGNYNSASSSATAFSIGKATPTVTPTVGTYTYTGSAQGPNTATNSGTGTSYTFSYVGVSGTTYSASSTPPTNVGSYTVTATVLASSDGNYNSASSTATAFSIGKATPIVTPTVGTYTYTGSAQGPNAATNSGTGTSYTFSYAGVSGTTYSASSTPPTNAGSYTVTATVLASADGFYNSASSSATAFSIGKLTPTVTPTVGTYIYTGSAQGPNTATNSGTGTSYTFSYVGVSGTTYSASSTPPTNAGSYTVTATVLASADGNYNSASSSAVSFSIGKVGLTVKADNKTVNYGDAVPTLTYTATGFVNGESSSVFSGSPSLSTLYTSTTLPSASPATISISAGTLAATNYSFSFSNGTITISSSSSIWTGGTSQEWVTSGNWDGNVTPSSGADIIIVSGSSHYPVLNTDKIIGALNLQSGSTVTINSNTLTINGAISGSGTLTGSSTSNLVIGGAAGTINFTPGSTVLYNLTLNTNASATLGSHLDIAGGPNGSHFPSGTLTIGSSAVFNTADGLTLKSDDDNTAVVAAIPENGTGLATGIINGKVTIERNIHSSTNGNPNGNGNNNYVNGNAKRAWRLLTAPVAGGTGSPSIYNAWQNNGTAYDANNIATQGIGTLITAPSATNGIDYPSNFSMYTWDSGHQSFSGVTNTLTDISAGTNGNADNTGYFIFVRGDRNLATIGNPAYGGLIIDNTTLSCTGNLQTGRQQFATKPSIDFIHNRRYTLVGNPYASPIDLSKLTLNNVIKTYYTWNPNLNTVGGFVTISDDGSGNHLVVSTAGAGINNQDTLIQSGQAFFVLGDVNAGSASITFDESDKVNANNNYVFRPTSGTSVTQSFRSNLYLLNPDSSTILADGNLAQYNTLYSAGVDYMDALKFGNLNESFGLLRNGTLLAIERRPIITANDTLFLNLTKTTLRSYQFQFDATLLNNPGLTGFFKDSYKGDSVELNLSGITAINFSINSDAASQNPNRFMIVFEPLSQAGPLPVTFTSVKAAPQNGDIAVNWNVDNEISIKSYEVEKSTDGVTFTEVANVKATGGSSVQYNWLDVNAVSGENYYRIRSIGNDGAIQYSAIVKVNIATANPMIALYTNPITDGVAALQFTNEPAGLYTVKMLSTLGQVIATKTISHAGGSSIETMPLRRGLAKGTYELQIVNPGNGTTTFKVECQ